MSANTKHTKSKLAQSMDEAFGVHTPVNETSFVRTCMSLVIGALSAIGSMALGLQLAESLALGVMALSGWAALAYAFWIVVSTLTVIGSVYLGAWCAKYVFSRDAKKDAVAVSKFVGEKWSSWFSKPEPATVH